LHDVLLLQHTGLQSGDDDRKHPANIAIAGSYPAAMYLAMTKCY
jgi:hypothetical protein